MQNEIATTKLQSDRLMACGLLPNTADMTLSYCNGGFYELMAETFHYGCFDERDVPSWSQGRLLELIPSSLKGPTGTEYRLELRKLRMHDAWEVQWFDGQSRYPTYDKNKKFHKLWDASPIEACVKAIEWLTSMGYKLNN